MPHGEAHELIAASSEEVFDLVHDYSRRLEWDTLLRAAYLDDGHTAAGLGATSVCVGRWSVGGMGLKTVYVSYDRPTVAAVKMLNRPPFFESWAASIRHDAVSERESRITYKFNFTTRPQALRWLLDPVVRWVFLQETRKRLRALKAHFERQG